MASGWNKWGLVGQHEMRIQRATKQYEAWLGEQTAVIAADLEVKHQQMAAGVFPFLRATFYRWAQVWPEVCQSLVSAPQVLAVGDLHVENFGTWRDAEGRLIWGINDFDETAPLPYTHDLVRLATSALLAIEAGHLSLAGHAACEAICKGYREGLQAGGRPIVLEAEHGWLRAAAMTEERAPKAFWAKLTSLTTVQNKGDWQDARDALELLLPEPHPAYRVVHRLAGLGSLGRQRWVALAEWQGGQIAREAKALLPSAVYWAAKQQPRKIAYKTILRRAVRASDPFVRPQGRWVIRRLAPDCSRVELAALAADRDETRLLTAMGLETANTHLGTPDAAPAILDDFERQPDGWLHSAAKAMAQAVTYDYEDWRAEKHEKQ